jgi:hypothetical protein
MRKINRKQEKIKKDYRKEEKPDWKNLWGYVLRKNMEKDEKNPGLLPLYIIRDEKAQVAQEKALTWLINLTLLLFKKLW